jgi:hypothetical protein
MLFGSTFIWLLLDSSDPTKALPPLDRPQSIYNMVLRAEFVVSATMAAAGILVRRRKVRELSLMDYIIVLSCASVTVLCVFKMPAWFHFAN